MNSIEKKSKDFPSEKYFNGLFFLCAGFIRENYAKNFHASLITLICSFFSKTKAQIVELIKKNSDDPYLDTIPEHYCSSIDKILKEEIVNFLSPEFKS